MVGKIIELEAYLRDTVRQVKSKIQEVEGIPPDQQHITFADKELRDENTLSSYGIKKKSTLHLIIHVVKIMTGETRELKVNHNDTIGQIKQTIQDMDYIPSNQQHITFADKELYDQNTLSYYNIQNESILNLTTLEMKQMISEMMIRVKTMTGTESNVFWHHPSG